MESLLGLGPPTRLYPYLLFGSDRVIQHFSVTQEATSKGNLQWSTWVNTFITEDSFSPLLQFRAQICP